jgi:hypothetical protein
VEEFGDASQSLRNNYYNLVVMEDMYYGSMTYVPAAINLEEPSLRLV